MGDVVGFAGEPKGTHATAEWHRFNGTSFDKVATATLLATGKFEYQRKAGRCR